MALLDGKKIKKAYLHRYVSTIVPEDPVDENGIERPEKNMRYFIVLDQNNFAYLIPGVYDREKQNWLKAYEPEDLVDAAAGDVEKQNKINDIHSKMRAAYFNDKLFTENWIQEYYEGTKNTFCSQYNNRLQERGLPTISIDDLPTKAKTIDNFTQEEIKTIASNAIVPPPPVQNGGQDRF